MVSGHKRLNFLQFSKYSYYWLLDSELDNGTDWSKYRSTIWKILACIATVLCPELGREYEEKFVPKANDNMSFDPVSLSH